MKMTLESVRKQAFKDSTSKWWLNNKLVACREYGGGAELVDQNGNLVADFTSHLDLEWFIDNHLKIAVEGGKPKKWWDNKPSRDESYR